MELPDAPALHRQLPIYGRKTEQRLSLRKRLFWGVRVGGVFGCVLAGLALVVTVIAMVTQPGSARELAIGFLLIVCGYVAGGISVGAIVGTFFPLWNWLVGRVVVCVLAMMCFYMGIAPVVNLLQEKRIDFSLALVVPLGIYSGVGIGVLSWRAIWSTDGRQDVREIGRDRVDGATHQMLYDERFV